MESNKIHFVCSPKSGKELRDIAARFQMWAKVYNIAGSCNLQSALKECDSVRAQGAIYQDLRSLCSFMSSGQFEQFMSDLDEEASRDV